MTKKAPWHADGSDVYHECTNCTEGNNIEPRNKRVEQEVRGVAIDVMT